MNDVKGLLGNVVLGVGASIGGFITMKAINVATNPHTKAKVKLKVKQIKNNLINKEKEAE